MNYKKLLPIIVFALLGVLAIGLRRCNSKPKTTRQTTQSKHSAPAKTPATTTEPRQRLDRNATELFFTKHAKCRMQCRQISQQEVRDILATGTINYNKSELDDPKGPTYAVEGTTKDRQHIRVIFAPKQKHLSVVTVIDLDEEHPCNC